MNSGVIKGLIVIAIIIIGLGYTYWNEAKSQPSELEISYHEQYHEWPSDEDLEYYKEHHEWPEREEDIEALRSEDPEQYALTINENAIPWEDAYDHIGENVTVCGYVTNVSGSDPVYVDVGGEYPDNRVTGVIWPEYEDEFINLESLEGEIVYMEGELYDYNGTPNIKIVDSSQIYNLEWYEDSQ